VAPALTRRNAALPAPRSCHRRASLPSMALTSASPPVAAWTPATQPRKHAAQRSGSSAAHTRLNVSCDGMPCGTSRNVASQARFALPSSSTSTHPSAPQIVAHSAIVRMAMREWCFVRSTRGSSTAAKCAALLTSCPCSIASLTLLHPVQPAVSPSRAHAASRHFRCNCPGSQLEDGGHA